MTSEEYIKWQNDVDVAFISNVQKEVTQSCALPFALPVDRIPAFIVQAAEWFWLNCDWCSEERMYVIKNSDICKCSGMNKIIQLPSKIIGVHGVYKTTSQLRYGMLGDFSLERMMMSSYSQFGGVGSIGGGLMGNNMTGYSLADVVTSMYEVDTFNQSLNPPLTYDYNIFSHKLVILGDLKQEDLLINCYVRTNIQDLYNNYYFFRFVVCLAKQALSGIYGRFEFKLPGGIQINYSSLSDEADKELDEIKEWVNNHNGVAYFFQPNTL